MLKSKLIFIIYLSFAAYGNLMAAEQEDDPSRYPALGRAFEFYHNIFKRDLPPLKMGMAGYRFYYKGYTKDRNAWMILKGYPHNAHAAILVLNFDEKSYRDLNEVSFYYKVNLGMARIFASVLFFEAPFPKDFDAGLWVRDLIVRILKTSEKSTKTKITACPYRTRAGNQLEVVIAGKLIGLIEKNQQNNNREWP